MSLGPFIIPGESSEITILVVFALIVLMLAVGLTFRRKNKRRLLLRIIMNIICVLSLFLIALQPLWVTSSVLLEAILLAPGADSRTIKSFVDSVHTEFHTFSLDSTVHGQSTTPDIEVIPDLAYLKRHYPEIRTLHVFGYGLPDFDWPEIKSIKIKYYPTQPPSGISQINWPRRVQIGQALQIQGSVKCLSDHESWITLSGPGGLVDSVQIGVGDGVPFELNTVPLDTGRYLYTLNLKSNENILFQEKIGISVVPPNPLKILLLEHSPRFETKYLKNWLARQQNSLAIRTTVSQKRFRFEYLNFPEKVDVKQITAPLLQQFDLLIIDGKTLNDLDSKENRALTESVESGGLGVLIMPDALLLDEKSRKDVKDILSSRFKLNQFSELDQRLVKLTIPNSQDSLVTPVAAEPFELTEQWGMQSLMKDQTGRILAGAFRRGKGIVGMTLIKSTYKWILEGKPQFHAGYWSHILSGLVRKDLLNDKWTIGQQGPAFVNQPIELRLSTSAIQPTGKIQTEPGGGDEIYLKQDKLNPNRWQGTYWPKHEGWHSVSTQAGNPFWFYVHEKTDWQTWRQYQKVEATKRFAALNLISTKKAKFESTTRDNSIPLFWFFFIFLISSAVLWVEQKI